MPSLWRASVRAERRCSTISLSKSKACQPRGYAFEFHLASQIISLRTFSAFRLTADKPEPLKMANILRKRTLFGGGHGWAACPARLTDAGWVNFSQPLLQGTRFWLTAARACPTAADAP